MPLDLTSLSLRCTAFPHFYVSKHMQVGKQTRRRDRKKQILKNDFDEAKEACFYSKSSGRDRCTVMEVVLVDYLGCFKLIMQFKKRTTGNYVMLSTI